MSSHQLPPDHPRALQPYDQLTSSNLPPHQPPSLQPLASLLQQPDPLAPPYLYDHSYRHQQQTQQRQQPMLQTVAQQRQPLHYQTLGQERQQPSPLNGQQYAPSQLPSRSTQYGSHFFADNFMQSPIADPRYGPPSSSLYPLANHQPPQLPAPRQHDQLSALYPPQSAQYPTSQLPTASFAQYGKSAAAVSYRRPSISGLPHQSLQGPPTDNSSAEPIHPLGSSAFLPISSQPSAQLNPYAHVLDPGPSAQSLQSDALYMDSSRRQMAELQRRLSVDAFNPASAGYARLPVSVSPGSSNTLAAYQSGDRHLDRQRYLPASAIRRTSFDAQLPVPVHYTYARQPTNSSVRSDDDPYIDITGNSTPMPLRSPTRRDGDDDLDAEGVSDHGSGSEPPSRRYSQQSDSFALPRKQSVSDNYDVHSAFVSQDTKGPSGQAQTGAKRGKGSTRGAKAGTKRGAKKANGTERAPRKPKVVDPTASKKPRAPKQPKRSRKDSRIAEEIGEKATLDLAVLQQELQRASEQGKDVEASSEKPDTLLQLLHASSVGRKRKRVDYAALLRGAEDACHVKGEDDGEDSGRSHSPTGSTPNPSSPKPGAVTATPQTSDDRNRVYCICRKPFDGSADNEFYIGCEGCDEWFHGRCVNVTEQEAGGIEQWMCAACEERGLLIVRKIVCAAPGCGKYVEPDSRTEMPADAPTPAAATPDRPTHHFPRPLPAWVPTENQRKRYCSQPCALSTARTVLRDRVAPPLRILAPPPREEQADALEAHARLAQWHAVQEADRADQAALARFEAELARRRAGLRRLTRRRERIRGAIVAARNLHPAAVAAPDCATVALVDRLCGYDFRITGEWVVDLDDDDEDADGDIGNESIDPGGADEKATVTKKDEEAAAAPLCLAKGRCPLHEGWDAIKHAEIELDIGDAVAGIRDLLARRRSLLSFMVARRKPPPRPLEAASTTAMVV
ncbi:CXXC-type zinc finger protein 1 [Geranomyces variabilis]|uniref:CXXC-type zinc finger protein 1 n=1 Tax=Geranomyces variabilis TaxID=109894 RepID=A0AAD5TIQ0_9FUNG|nr:CXXC-type zinc finger protein 1 [Geranomyces variabilis]